MNETSAERDNVAVLVASCDEFNDVWPGFFKLFFEFWPDCPYPISLGSDTQTWNDSRVRNLTIPDCADKHRWTHRVRGMLERIPETHVLLLLEDFLITAPVNTERIRRHVRDMRVLNAPYLRLFPAPGPTSLCEGREDIGEVAVGLPYRICTQASLWEKAELTQIMRDGESIWDFEHGATVRSASVDRPILAVTRRLGIAGDTPTIENAAICYLCTAVVRGVWLRDAVALCRRHGIEPDLTRRAMEPLFEYVSRVVLPRWFGSPAVIVLWQLRRVKRTIRAYARRALDRVRPPRVDSGSVHS